MSLPPESLSEDETTSVKPRILLIEDYEPNILVATTYLEFNGYEFEVARNGFEAVEKANSNVFSAILMDVNMPGINGFDATQAIRIYETETHKPRTPIIGMTAHALTGDRERCISAGMDDYVAKPVSEDQLVQKLKALIK